MLRFVQVIVAVLTIALLYSALWEHDLGMSTINGALDGLFGWSLRAIVKFHFPSSNEENSDKGLIGKILSKL